MAIERFYMTRGDLAPPYPFRVVDPYNRPVDLTSATIYCTMVSGSGAVKINNSTAGIVITDGLAGEAEREWQAGDSDEAGLFQIEFKIKLPTGEPFTVPREADGEAYVEIAHPLAS